MSDWKTQLEEFDEAYHNAKPPEGGGDWNSDPVPDGKYQARVKSCDLANSKSSGSPMIKWCFTIVGGNKAYLKRYLWKNSVIQENTLGFIKKDLAIFGIKLPMFSKLPSILPRMVGRVVEIQKVQDGQYSNIYINKAAKQSPAEEAGLDESDDDESGSEGDDKIPF